MTDKELFRMLWQRPLHQTCKVNEELGEFMVELNRLGCGRMDRGKLVEETADVLVVIYGMAEALGLTEDIKQVSKEKIERTKERMKKRSRLVRHEHE